MKSAEALAKRIIEGIEVGERMIYREDQSTRTHDFDLHRTAGTVAAVEVTSITDGTVRATFAAIDRCRWIPRTLCTKDWRVHTAPNAVIKRIAANAYAYLADIEAEGLEQFFAPRDASTVSSVKAIWHDLRIVGGRTWSWKEPAIGIALPITGGAYGPRQVLEAMETVATASDNREKLANSGAVERHLAIYVDRCATSVLMALRDFNPPNEPPDLPSEVTEVWLFSETYGENRYVVWSAAENRPWQRFVLASMPEELLVVVEGDEIAASAASSGRAKPLSKPETQ